MEFPEYLQLKQQYLLGYDENSKWPNLYSRDIFDIPVRAQKSIGFLNIRANYVTSSSDTKIEAEPSEITDNLSSEDTRNIQEFHYTKVGTEALSDPQIRANLSQCQQEEGSPRTQLSTSMPETMNNQQHNGKNYCKNCHQLKCECPLEICPECEVYTSKCSCPQILWQSSLG